MDLALVATHSSQNDEEYEKILQNLHQLEWNSSRKYDQERDEEIRNLRKEILLLKALNQKSLAEKYLEIAQKKIEWQKSEIKLLERESKTLKFLNRQIRPILFCKINNEIERLEENRQEMQKFYNGTMERMQKELNRVLNFIEITFTEEEIRMVHKFLDNLERIYNESQFMSDDDDSDDASGEVFFNNNDKSNVLISEPSNAIQVEPPRPNQTSKPKLTTVIEVAESQDESIEGENIFEHHNLANESLVKKTRFDLNISYQDKPTFGSENFDKKSLMEEKPESMAVKTSNTKSDPRIFARISPAIKSIINPTSNSEQKLSKNKDDSFDFKKPSIPESFNFEASTTTKTNDEAMLFNKISEKKIEPEVATKDFFAVSPLNNFSPSPENKTSGNFAFVFSASPEGEENQASPGGSFQFNFNQTCNQDKTNESFQVNFF